MSFSFQHILYVGLGGFIGSAARYLIYHWSSDLSLKSGFPIGTITVNLLGCFLIGFLFAFFELKEWGSESLRLFTFAGVLGSFTTFSTFLNDSYVLIHQDQITNALLNIGIQVIAGLFLVWLGYFLCKA